MKIIRKDRCFEFLLLTIIILLQEDRINPRDQQANSPIVVDSVNNKEKKIKGASPIIFTDPITQAKADELRKLSQKIRQLQNLAKYTKNFTDLDNLIAEDMHYLNRIDELQPHHTQIKNFLHARKPYFIYNSQTYFIEDIASYHIHAGDYSVQDKPKGAHSNYGGNKLHHFNPKINKHGALHTQEVTLHNPRFKNKIKLSSVYPEKWSEYTCDLKAIEAMMNKNAKITLSKNGTSLKIVGKTTDDLEIIIHYHIKTKSIITHFPHTV